MRVQAEVRVSMLRVRPKATHAPRLTFALYEEQQGGTALWSETQNVALDDQGRYTVLLGSTQPEGLPLDLFASGKVGGWAWSRRCLVRPNSRARCWWGCHMR